ncbi:MAG: hypothetical protein HY831_01990 [Candidatus Aenigmarchaeota archaeon]|nr:hypothetical protein [Candidatus Aenigmarchaeota archaeon]
MTEWTDSIVRKGFSQNYVIKKVIYSGKSKFQKIEIIEIPEFGKALFLDGVLQICESDSVIYDKSLVDPIFKINPNTKKIAILGGGDGGVLREVLTHKVDKAIMIEIDKDVIDVCKKYLPEVCKSAFEDKRTSLMIEDATKVIKKEKDLDAVIVDLIDPEMMTKSREKDLYKALFLDIKNSLKKNGVISIQLGSYYEKDLRDFILEIIKDNFKNISIKQVFIPSFVENWMFATSIKK